MYFKIHEQSLQAESPWLYPVMQRASARKCALPAVKLFVAKSSIFNLRSSENRLNKIENVQNNLSTDTNLQYIYF